MNTLELAWPKYREGANFGFLKVFLYFTRVACTHIRIGYNACLHSESLSSTLLIQLLSSPPPAWLVGPHHSPQSKPFLEKAAVKTREKLTRKKFVKQSLYRSLTGDVTHNKRT